MYPYKSKQRFKRLSILIPYIILCLTAGGFHTFDEYAYHNHNSKNHHSETIDSSVNKPCNNKPILCCNDHNEDNCIICKWLKSTSKRIQLVLDISHFIQGISGLCVSDQQAYYFLNNRRRFHSRNPPSITT